jgi:putative sigma-54 modulation protein
VRTIVRGRNLDVPELDRRYAQQKMRRLERLLDDRSEAIVELAVERHRRVEDTRIVEVILVIDGRPVRGVARAASHRAAIDEVIDKLERQAVELKERPRVRGRSVDRRRRAPGAEAEGSPTAAERGAAEPPRVVKVKRFAIEPMFEEDAIVRMEELGHSFFVFVNAENERVAILYRRTHGDFGLIEPAIGGEYTTEAQTRRRAPGARAARG